MTISTGPCSDWTDGASVQACCPVDIGSDDPDTVFAESIAAASELLFELSGRQFSGVCEQIARPCVNNCNCWADLFSPARVPAVPWSFGWWGYGWGWGFEGCGQDTCGCGPLSRALLSGYPVQEIVEVEIAGEVVDPAGYRLDEWRWLTRLDTADGENQFWPSCQDLSRDLGEPGTWSVTYRFGQEIPTLGALAANQLACEVYRSCQTGTEGCNLPLGVTSITRQGVTIERAPFVAWGLYGQGRGTRNWATGLPFVDAFLSAFNPQGIRGRSAVWSPDIDQYPLIVGEGSP